jgi:hypothetical protein
MYRKACSDSSSYRYEALKIVVADRFAEFRVVFDLNAPNDDASPFLKPCQIRDDRCVPSVELMEKLMLQWYAIIERLCCA